MLFTQPTEEAQANDPHVTPVKRTRKHVSRGSPTRKRKRHEAVWIKNVRKTNKNLGLEYVSTKGKVVSAVKMKEPCSCSWNCRHLLTPEDRDKIFSTFWASGNHDRQWDFIRNSSRRKETSPRAKNNQPAAASKKKWFYSYFFKCNDEEIKVCKTMFLSTLGIGESWVGSAWNHLNPDKGNTVSPDKRGRHNAHPIAITPEKIETVKEHIKLFPRVPSHYCRKDSEREYLERGLSGEKMAKQYVKWARDKGIPKRMLPILGNIRIF